MSGRLRIVTRSLTLATGLLLCFSVVARADERASKIEAAESAVEELQYEQAFRLYEEAKKAGGASPKELRRMYLRLAELSATMNEGQTAAQNYLKLLALTPDYKVAKDAPDSHRLAFERALEKRGALSLLEFSASYAKKERVVNVVVGRDTLNLAASVRIVEATGDTQERSRTGAGDERLWFRLRNKQSSQARVQLLDVDKNVLEEKTLATTVVSLPVVAKGPRNDERSLLTRPSVWLGAGAIVAGATSLGLGLSVQSREDRLNQIAENPSEFTLQEFRNAEDAATSRARWTNIALISTGALATAAVVSFFLERRGRSTESVQAVIAPDASGGVSAALYGRF